LLTCNSSHYLASYYLPRQHLMTRLACGFLVVLSTLSHFYIHALSGPRFLRKRQMIVQRATSSLEGVVAVVTGSSRGIGKGVELGEAGATVYVTGRSMRGAISTERDLGNDNNDATIEATCEAINAGGGHGIPVRCDFSNDAEVASLMAQVKEEQGRLDVLVCSAFTTPPQLNEASFRDDFWKQGAAMWDACHIVGLRGAYMAACEASPLMIDTQAANSNPEDRRKPLIVLVSSFGGVSYTFNVAYGVGKAGIDRLASDMHVQLENHGVETVALYPGLVKTEGNLAMDARGEWAAASGGFDLSKGESPRFSGRAVVALLGGLPSSSGDKAQLPRPMEGRSGNVVVVSELAKELGFTDIDGKRPPSIRSLQFILPNFVFPQIEKESPGKPLPLWIKNNVPDILLPWSVFAGGPPPAPPPS